MKKVTILNVVAGALSVAVAVLFMAVTLTHTGEPPPPKDGVPKACEDFVVRSEDGAIRVVSNGTCRPCVRGCLDIVRERLGSTPEGVSLLMGCFDRCDLAGAGKMQLRIAVTDAGPVATQAGEDR